MTLNIVFVCTTFDESIGPSKMHQQIPLPLISQDGEFNASEDGEFNAENQWSVGEDVPCAYFEQRTADVCFLFRFVGFAAAFLFHDVCS